MDMPARHWRPRARRRLTAGIAFYRFADNAHAGTIPPGRRRGLATAPNYAAMVIDVKTGRVPLHAVNEDSLRAIRHRSPR